MNGIIRSIIPTVLCLSLGLGVPSAFAKNQCKGMSKSACTADQSCTWVKGYVTKNGNKVDPYCRVKGKKMKAGENKAGAEDKAKKAKKAKGADKGKKAEKAKNADKDKKTMKMKEKVKKKVKAVDKQS